MRPIKFRAWDEKRKQMSMVFNPVCHGDYNFMRFDGVIYLFEPDWILMQFTGLHDKNGKEIYEGDIIKQKAPKMNQDKGDEVIMEVIYTPPFYQGKVINENGWHWTEWPTEYFDECEAIGNIYENPELLKEGK